jgi:hypothetical protein
MAELNDLPNEPESTPVPFLTLVSTLGILLVFGFACILIYKGLATIESKSDVLTGEEKLEKLKDEQSKWLRTEGYDTTTKSNRIPIDQAMEYLIGEATKNQKLPLPSPKK